MVAKLIFKARDENPICYENAMLLIGQHNLKPSKSRQEKYDENPMLKELVLRDFEFYKEKIGMKQKTFEILQKIYYSFPSFDYKASPSDIKEITRESHTGTKFVYVGEVVPGTKIRKGMGITVYASGEIYEGYREDAKPHYFGRYIHISGLVRNCGYNKGSIYGYCEEHTMDLTQSPRRAMSSSTLSSDISTQTVESLKKKLSVFSFHETQDDSLW
eukprot:CAMPEP_0168334236 /NCGR_PEP_ID=MMETSP0213-20121227/10137_1 /TAXON_ID=151035 /ORGANISM="Euplotes harpa, Strain FSP1.4" /LENGTH=215 /DNA_ID=CAMNT_0008338821 /DNA_START=366 /DNA_END=1010 /DNA_ORIENTATION=+